MKGFIHKTTSALATLLVLLTALSYLPIESFLFELLSHFRFHFLVSALIGFLLAIYLRRKGLVLIAVILIVINGIEIYPWYQPVTNNSASGGTKLRLMHSNVLWLNSDYVALLTEVENADPDIVVLQEFTNEWSQNVSELSVLYPYQIFEPRDSGFGMALFSKYPLKESAVFENSDFGIVTIQTKLRLDNKLVNIIAIHPPPPMNSLMYSLRDKEFVFIKEKVSKLKGPLVLLGDFNSTMWSPSYKKLIAGTDMQNTRKGFGVLPSWPNYLPVGGIPIDHCLVRGLQVDEEL